MKSKTMAGFRAPYVPGWDCHGLPIEYKVVKESRGLSPLEVRQAIRSVRAQIRRYPARAIQAPRRVRRLGASVSDARPGLRSGDPARLRCLRREGARLRTHEAGLLEHRRADGPGRGGSGIPGPRGHGRLCEISDRRPARSQDKASIVIWTTTPWTLPANLAIAVHPKELYVVREFRKEGAPRRSLLAESARRSILRRDRLEPAGEPISSFPGSKLEGIGAQHPFLPRTSIILTADFVTMDTGTGCVHIAPGHGEDDYSLGRKNGLADFFAGGRPWPLHRRSRVAGTDRQICFRRECRHRRAAARARHAGGGEKFTSIPIPIAGARKRRSSSARSNNSLSASTICAAERSTRSRGEMDSALGRESHLRHGRIAARLGDLAPAQLGRAAAGFLFGRQARRSSIPNGFASWPISSRNAARTSGSSSMTPRSRANSVCRKARASQRHDRRLDRFRRSATRRFCATHPELRDPADMYLEATDQHRGWFQSSLMTSVALHDRAPYKTCVTHGFVVDVDGKKISKSSSYSKPMDAGHFVGKHGADIVRLWVSSVNYTDDVPFSEEMFTRLGDTYRRIRNTLRILLGNLHDFELPREHGKQARRFHPGRSLDSRSSAAGDRRMPGGLCGLRISQGLSHTQSILRGRSEQSLRRHHQGPDVLRRGRFAAPARDAGRDARNLRRALTSCSRRSSFSPLKKRGAISAARRLGSFAGISRAAG